MPKIKEIISLAEAREAKERLDAIRCQLKVGSISYDEAKLRTREPLKFLNSYMEQRARDFGVKYRAVHFVGFMR